MHTVYISEQAVDALRNEWLSKRAQYDDFLVFMRQVYGCVYDFDWRKDVGGTLNERYWITCVDEQKAVQYKLMWS